MAPITETLLSIYSVHGTLLIFSGIALNGTVLGLLIFYSLPGNNDKTTSETSETTETELYETNCLNEDTREYGNSEKENLLMHDTEQEKDQIDQKQKKSVPNYQGLEHTPEMAKDQINTDEQTKSDWRDLLNNKAYYLYTIGSLLSHTSMKTVLGRYNYFFSFLSQVNILAQEV